MKSEKGLAPILILVGIAVVIGIATGAYYFGKSQTPKPQPQITVTPAPSAKVDETANWKKYTSLNNLYSLSYPSNWYQYGDKEALKDGSFTQYFSSKPDSVNRWGDLKDTDYALAVTISPMSATTYESGKTYLEMFSENNQIIGKKRTGVKENVELVGLPIITGVKSIEIERTTKEGTITDLFYVREIILQKDSFVIRIGIFSKNRENFQSKQKIINQILSTFKFLDQKNISVTDTHSRIINIIEDKWNMDPKTLTTGTWVDKDDWIYVGAGYANSSAAYIFQKNGSQLELVYYGQECPSRELITARKIPEEILTPIDPSGGCKK